MCDDKDAKEDIQGAYQKSSPCPVAVTPGKDQHQPVGNDGEPDQPGDKGPAEQSAFRKVANDKQTSQDTLKAARN
jgi:hypothetical protein